MINANLVMLKVDLFDYIAYLVTLKQDQLELVHLITTFSVLRLGGTLSNHGECH